MIDHSAVENSRGVIIWWMFLSVVGVVNIFLWSLNLVHFNLRKLNEENNFIKLRRWQVILSAGYVFGCAFRSFFPRADVQRICLFNSWISSVALGRSVATIAELCFVAQWALVLYEMARGAQIKSVRFISYMVVPLIAVAEIFSWYATLTTNYLGNSVEESIWTLTSLLLIVSLFRLRSSFDKKIRNLISLAIFSTVAYFIFMSLVDVPMYLSRWHVDQVNGRQYLTVLDGIKDVSSRWIVTRRWQDWATEIPWMSLYFSAAVWLSISLIRMPQLDLELTSAKGT